MIIRTARVGVDLVDKPQPSGLRDLRRDAAELFNRPYGVELKMVLRGKHERLEMEVTVSEERKADVLEQWNRVPALLGHLGITEFEDGTASEAPDFGQSIPNAADLWRLMIEWIKRTDPHAGATLGCLDLIDMTDARIIRARAIAGGFADVQIREHKGVIGKALRRAWREFVDADMRTGVCLLVEARPPDTKETI